MIVYQIRFDCDEEIDFRYIEAMKNDLLIKGIDIELIEIGVTPRQVAILFDHLIKTFYIGSMFDIYRVSLGDYCGRFSGIKIYAIKERTENEKIL